MCCRNWCNFRGVSATQPQRTCKNVQTKPVKINLFIFILATSTVSPQKCFTYRIFESNYYLRKSTSINYLVLSFSKPSQSRVCGMAQRSRTGGHLHRNHKSELKKPQPAWPLDIWQSHPGHSLECLDMAPDPLSFLQTICRRTPKLHLTWLTIEEVLNVIFTYNINKINLCSPESDAYRQLFLSFLSLVFQNK